MSGKDFSFPLRTELTVLSADNPKSRTVGFSITEKVGVAAYNARGVTKLNLDRKPFLEFLLDKGRVDGGEAYGLAFYDKPGEASIYVRLHLVRGEAGKPAKIFSGVYSLVTKKIEAFNETADQLRETERSYRPAWDEFLLEVDRLLPAAEVMRE